MNDDRRDPLIEGGKASSPTRAAGVMRILERCRLVDALGEWGAHEARSRLGREVRDALDALEVGLTYRSPLLARILAAGPLGCVRVELSAEDLPQLIIADGRPATEWATAVEQDGTRSGGAVRALAAAEEPVVGPLTCVCVGQGVDRSLQLRPPFVIFDGWHRGAGWILHAREGKTYPIAVNLIITQRPVNLLGQAS